MPNIRLVDMVTKSVCKLQERNDIDVYEDIIGLPIFQEFIEKT